MAKRELTRAESERRLAAARAAGRIGPPPGPTSAKRGVAKQRALRALRRRGSNAGRWPDRFRDILTAATGLSWSVEGEPPSYPFDVRIGFNLGGNETIDYLSLAAAFDVLRRDVLLRTWTRGARTMVGVSVYDPEIDRWLGRDEDCVTIGHAREWRIAMSHAYAELKSLAQRYPKSQVHSVKVWQ